MSGSQEQKELSMTNKQSFGSAVATCALGLAASCLIGGAAFAETNTVTSPASATQVTMQRQVRYGDLDLSTAKGRATLNDRVRFAASNVCDGKNVSNTKSQFAYLDCYSIAMRDATRQLDQRLASAQSSTVAAVR
jgi:UrcA family protein